MAGPGELFPLIWDAVAPDALILPNRPCLLDCQEVAIWDVHPAGGSSTVKGHGYRPFHPFESFVMAPCRLPASDPHDADPHDADPHDADPHDGATFAKGKRPEKGHCVTPRRRPGGVRGRQSRCRHRQVSRRLLMEGLEDRRVLAVAVALVGSELRITESEPEADVLRLSADDGDLLLSHATSPIGGGTDNSVLSDGDRTMRIPATDLPAGVQIRLSTGAGDDLLVVDATFAQLGADLWYDADSESVGGGLAIEGSGNETVILEPGTAAVEAGFDGRLLLGAVQVTYAALHGIDISRADDVTIRTPDANATLEIAEGFDFFAGGMESALRVTGTSGDTSGGAGDGVAIEPVSLWDNGSIAVETANDPVTDGDDRVRIVGAANDHRNASLRVATGIGDDVAEIAGDLSFSQEFRVESQQVLVGGQIIASGLVSLDAGGGGIDDLHHGIDVIAPRLALRAATGIGAGGGGGDPFDGLDTRVDELAFENVAAGQVRIRNDGALNLTAVDGLTESVSAGGGTVRAGSPLTIATDVSVGDDFSFVAIDSPAAGDDLVINPGVTVTAGENVSFLAGDDFFFPASASILSSGGVTIRGDHGNADPGVGSNVEVLGTIQATAVTIETGADADTILLDLANTPAPVTVDSGDGDDVIQVRATAGPTTLDLGSGDDVVNVSSDAPANSGDLGGIQGPLAISGGDGDDALHVSHFGGGTIAAGTLTDTVIDGVGNPAPITYAEIESLTIDLSDAGGDTLTVVDTHAGATTINGHGGDDVFNIRATGGPTTVNGGDGNELFHVSSDAPADTGNLDGILGPLNIVGGGQTAGADSTSVTARASSDPADDVTIDVTVPTGDRLVIGDQGSGVGHAYLLDPASLTRNPALPDPATIAFLGIERLELLTSPFADEVTVDGTASETWTAIDTGDGNDRVEVRDSGAASVLEVGTGAGADDVEIRSTGDFAVVRVITDDMGDDDPDRLTIFSIGEGAALDAFMGGGDDTVRLEPELPPRTRDVTSVLRISGGDGNDLFEIREVYLGTVIDLGGDGGDDTFVLIADGNDASGALGRLNDDPTNLPPEDSVARTRQLFIDGGDHLPDTLTVIDGVSVVAETSQLETVDDGTRGDRLLVQAGSSSLPLDLRYVIADTPSPGVLAGVLATTVPDTPRRLLGNEVVEMIGIESVDLVGGSADDILTVSSQVPIGFAENRQLISFDGGGGDNRFEIVGTDSADRIVVGEMSGDLAPFRLQNVQRVRIDAGDGDDQVVHQSAAIGVLNGGPGNDVMLGGPGSNLLAGGDGVDALFGGAGNTAIFSDQDYRDPEIFPNSGDLLVGGAGYTVCVQVGLDLVKNCDVLDDGGAQKDVTTWLRGLIFPSGTITMFGSLFAPFSPLADPPVPLFAVTEPSSIPTVLPAPAAVPDPPASDPPASDSPASDSIVPQSLSPLPDDLFESEADPPASGDDPPASGDEAATGEDPSTPPEPPPILLDVNRDGIVTAADALLVINVLSRRGVPQGESEDGPAVGSGRHPADVDGNGRVEALDALLVINALSRRDPTPDGWAGGDGEGEGMADSTDHRLSDAAWDDSGRLSVTPPRPGVAAKVWVPELRSPDLPGRITWGLDSTDPPSATGADATDPTARDAIIAWSDRVDRIFAREPGEKEVAEFSVEERWAAAFGRSDGDADLLRAYPKRGLTL